MKPFNIFSNLPSFLLATIILTFLLVSNIHAQSSDAEKLEKDKNTGNAETNVATPAEQPVKTDEDIDAQELTIAATNEKLLENTNNNFHALKSIDNLALTEFAKTLWQLPLTSGSYKKQDDEVKNTISSMNLKKLLAIHDEEKLQYELPVKNSLHLKNNPAMGHYIYTTDAVKIKTQLAEKRFAKALEEYSNNKQQLSLSIARDILLRNDRSPVAASAAWMLAGYYDSLRTVNYIINNKKIDAAVLANENPDHRFFEYISYILNVHGHTNEARIAFRVLIIDLIRGGEYNYAYLLLKQAFRRHAHLFYPTNELLQWPTEKAVARKERLRMSGRLYNAPFLRGESKLDIAKIDDSFFSKVDTLFYASLLHMVKLGNKESFFITKLARSNMAFKALETALTHQQVYAYSLQEKK